MSKRSPLLYLQDILASVNNIEEYIQGLTFEEFVKDQKTIDAVVRNFEIIGEAARNIPQDLLDKYPDLPWSKMISMRNKVMHEYFGIDEDILWTTIHEDLPELKEQFQELPELSVSSSQK